MQNLQKLKEKLGDSVQTDVMLKQYSTFKLGGPAQYFFCAKSSDDIVRAIQASLDLKIPFFILAGGSNILVNDEGFKGLVIKTENDNISIDGNIIHAETGLPWMSLIDFALVHSLTGVEWGVGIPGGVGGAVRGNAGAFGESNHQVVQSVEVLEITNDKVEVKAFSNDECKFKYRDSIFKHNTNLIILSVDYKLEVGDKDKIKKIMDDNLTYRNKTQPDFPSAGCIFKNFIVDENIKKIIAKVNPEGLDKIKGGKIGAGWFIDQAGLKGKVMGTAQVSNEHANFIIKRQEDTKASDIVMLISYVKQQVRDKFNLQLHEEVQYVGFPLVNS